MHKAEHHDFHPLLAELEGMTAEMTRLHNDAERYASLALNAQREVEPAAWTSRIEAAIDPEDNEKLEQLRLHRRETILWHTSVLFAYYIKCSRIHELRRRMSEVIGTLAKYGAGLTHKSEESWLKPIVLNNCVFAERVRNKALPDLTALPVLGDLIHADAPFNALKTAFDEMLLRLKHFPKCQTGHLFVGHSFSNLYPSEPVVRPAHIGQRWSCDEVRKVIRVDFVNSREKKRPACTRLVDLLQRLETADEKALAAMKALRSGQKGTVNEKQYAARLVQVLDRNAPTYSARAEKTQQHQHRLDYESARVVLYAEILAAEEARRQVVAALHEAIAETQQMQEEMAADKINTSEAKEEVRIAMINCLAADLAVRDSGRFHKGLHEEYQTDISAKQGTAALQQEFNSLFGQSA